MSQDPKNQKTTIAASWAEFAKSGREIDSQALIRLSGGWLGLAESVSPPLLFSIVFALTSSGLLSVVSASGLGLAFLLLRALRRQPLSGVLVGLVGIGFAAFLALREGGQTLDYFVPGFFTNAAYAAVLLISLLVGRPIMGFVIGFLAGAQNWREVKPLKSMALWLTAIWLGFFSLRLLVQVPLYFAGNIELLAATRAVLGAPAYVGLLALSWLIVKPLLRPAK